MRRDDIVQPGHIFPMTGANGGVLVRAGHTEAGCDLAGLAGLEPSAVICEIMNDDGTMARLPELMEFAKPARPENRHHRRPDSLPRRLGNAGRARVSKTVTTAHGDFCAARLRRPRQRHATHLALVKGRFRPVVETLVRVHEPLSVLDFLDPGSKQQSFSIDEAQAALAKNGHGVIVLMHRPEDRRSPALPPDRPEPKAGRVQTKWDPRTYGIGAQILRDLGVGKMRLLSSPRKMPSMTGFGLEVTGFVTSPCGALNHVPL
jgi:3,4-dihydroxy 2-butanone 4-phosphate synthase/GTP cyclohydrolase II